MKRSCSGLFLAGGGAGIALIAKYFLGVLGKIEKLNLGYISDSIKTSIENPSRRINSRAVNSLL